MKRHIVFGSVVAAIIILWGSSWYFIPQWYDKTSLEAGTFGDMFGAVNALFSGLAFAGLIYTITVQRQELSLQREAIKMQTEELRMQREETARSADQLEDQKNLTNLQLAMSVVNDLIKTKQERFEKVAVTADDIGWRYGEMAFRIIINENKGIPPYSKSLKIYIDLHFYILSFIKEYELTDKQKTLLYRLVRMHCIDEEIKVLYLSANSTPNIFRLNLLESAEYEPKPT